MKQKEMRCLDIIASRLKSEVKFARNCNVVKLLAAISKGNNVLIDIPKTITINQLFI